MRTCTAKLKSLTPYSASKKVDLPFQDKESHEDYDIRTWREKATCDDQGVVCIPAMGLKMAVDEAVKRLTVVIPGKKGATFTKFFLAGQICIDQPGIRLGVRKDDLEHIEIWANADGIRGSGKRVKRRFPYVQSWESVATFNILDDTITQEIFERALIEAGRLVGVGRFRPEKGGLLGRFKVAGFEWREE